MSARPSNFDSKSLTKNSSEISLLPTWRVEVGRSHGSAVLTAFRSLFFIDFLYLARLFLNQICIRDSGNPTTAEMLTRSRQSGYWVLSNVASRNLIWAGVKVVRARLDLGATTVVDVGTPGDDGAIGSGFTEAIGGHEWRSAHDLRIIKWNH